MIIAGKTDIPCDTIVRVKSNDEQINGVVGRITHPFPGVMAPGVDYVAGLRLKPDSGVFKGDICNLTSEDEIEILLEKKRCACGSDLFYASQVCYHDVIVNGDNIFDEDNGVSQSENPYGPYTCVQCGTEYEEKSDIPMFYDPREPERSITCQKPRVGDTFYHCHVFVSREASEGHRLSYIHRKVGIIKKITPARIYFDMAEDADETFLGQYKKGYSDLRHHAPTWLLRETTDRYIHVPHITYTASSGEDMELFATRAANILRDRAFSEARAAKEYALSLKKAISGLDAIPSMSEDKKGATR